MVIEVRRGSRYIWICTKSDRQSEEGREREIGSGIYT